MEPGHILYEPLHAYELVFSEGITAAHSFRFRKDEENIISRYFAAKLGSDNLSLVRKERVAHFGTKVQHLPCTSNERKEPANAA
uniref:WGS project CBMI000000000 data, contig CS3069_c002526 n=1 Tax=Fusarium clavum TaxID=2594811 RepID=A0A090N5R1_9HYPO|nr:unnamed protein product [Fusarium clavum]